LAQRGVPTMVAITLMSASAARFISSSNGLKW
jgi:hypothetical protein